MPTYFTISGSPKIYFMGMAINNNIINEIPSKNAISLNLFKLFSNNFNPSYNTLSFN